MAKYNITSLNYIASGTSRSYINMDVCLGYELFDYVHLLCSETNTSAYLDIRTRKTNDETKLSAVSVDIGTEQGEGYWAKTNYIEKADDSALARELCADGIVLNEEQDFFVEKDSSKRDYIRLYLSCCTEEMKQKIRDFNLAREHNNCTFLAEHSKNDKNELTCSGTRIQNLYDIVDVSIKKLGIKETRNSFITNTDQHHDVYAPALATQPLGFCQTNLESDFENDAILLTDGTKFSPYYLRTSQLNTRGTDLQSTSFTVHLESNQEKIYAYHEPNLGTSNPLENWTPKINYSGISKSWILDLPVKPKSTIATASDKASYDDGLVYAHRMMPTKSTLNSQYSTEMSSTSEIFNCRTYAEIKSVGGRPYLKYYDDVGYEAMVSPTSTSSLQTIPMKTFNSQTRSENDYLTKPYQKIEFLFPIDYKTKAKHKSNLFTVELSGTGIETEYQNVVQSLEEQASDAEAVERLLTKKSKLDMLKFDIESAVKEIVKNVTPANTQLFDIAFLD